MSSHQHLSDKAVVILSLIAKGYSYSQIVDGHPEITFRDIFAAAKEALVLNASAMVNTRQNEGIKKKYARAYERWSQDEDDYLSIMFEMGITIAEMAEYFERQPSAIRSRLAKLRLIRRESKE